MHTTFNSQSRARLIAGQGTLLFAGFTSAQICSFARNALLGHWLSQGDFGIAATITLLLQLLETLSDLGADRLIVQADDGDDPDLMKTAHALLILRGAITALSIYLAAAPVTHFFSIPNSTWAFELAALVPFIKGFQHLDARRFQRYLKNHAYLSVEVVPQLIAFAATIPALVIFGDYQAVVWLALTQACAALVLSHILAHRPYQVAWYNDIAGRFIRFGWPIWLSAFPLIAVYQGDRLVIGRLFGMEELAAYTAAFMIAMVPGLLAGKVGNALMLPLLANEKHHRNRFKALYLKMADAIIIVAAAYFTVFALVGEHILPVAFGNNYQGLGEIIVWLAAMWAMRMVQAVPGMALMAQGETRPFFAAGCIRALGLIPAIWVAHSGYGLAGVAAAGFFAETASLIYVVIRAGLGFHGAIISFFYRCLFLAVAGFLALSLTHVFAVSTLSWAIVQALVMTLLTSSLLLFALPLGRHMWQTLHRIYQAALS